MNDYPAILDQAWQDHLAPRAVDAPTVVSLFAGCGGSSLGYSMAGFRELLAVEWDDHAAGCLRRNFPHTTVIHADVTTVDPGVLPIPPGKLDVLDGSPPCQGFSLAGKLRLDDPRNFLFREYVRLLRAWRPRVFVMENVSSLGTGRRVRILAEVLDELRAAGYTTTARELLASYYQVPSRRRRLVIVGTRRDLKIPPSHPAPFSSEITFSQAVSGLPAIGLLTEINNRHALLAPHVAPGEYGRHVLTRGGRKPSYYGLCRVAWDAPGPTVTKSHRAQFLHPRYNRVLGHRELCRVQSFPDDYDWADSTYEQIQARLGNNVPPLLMRAIGRHLRNLLAEAVNHPGVDTGR
jgi:DNA (cytosine-5)-methyltransferase 1